MNNAHQVMRDWVVSAQHEIFFTLKLKNGYDISDVHAERVVRQFLNRIDRIYWGKQVAAHNQRCPRFVFKQYGKSGYNTHFHVVMATDSDIYTQLQILRSTWAQFAETCSISSHFEKAHNTQATGTYCTHEWAHLGNETFCDQLSHTSSSAGTYTGKKIHKLRRLLKAL